MEITVAAPTEHLVNDIATAIDLAASSVEISTFVDYRLAEHWGCILNR